MNNVLRMMDELDALLATLDSKLTTLEVLVEEDTKVLEDALCVRS